MPIILFFCLVFPAQVGLCAEEYELSNRHEILPAQPLPDGRIWLIHDQGRPLPHKEALPYGYVLTATGDLVTPDGVTFFADGSIGTPQGRLKSGELPKNFRRLPDGSILTPEGLRLKLAVPHPQEAVKDQTSAAKPKALQQSANPPKQTALWEMLPLSASREEKKPAQDEKKAQEKPAQSPSPYLAIPPKALAAKDLSFLDGCWQSNDLPAYLNIWRDLKNPGRLTKAQVCFNAKGQGTIRYFDHGTCTSKIAASIRGKTLTFQSREAFCPDGTKFAVRNFECQGNGAQTQCAVLAKSKGVTRRSLVHFKKTR